MLSRKIILATLASCGLILSLLPNKTLATMNHQVSTTQFRRIEQTLPIKAAVTISGLGLIGLELWWFLMSKSQP
jgi:plastocyanin domain-containing protein